jgi:hypothetical protein
MILPPRRCAPRSSSAAMQRSRAHGLHRTTQASNRPQLPAGSLVPVAMQDAIHR